jgi:hypothetical protein
MQTRPDKTALLMAIARFLVEDARPALADPRLNFRALIAANLANIVAAELASDDAHVTREIDRLRKILPVSPPPALTPDERRAQLSEMSSALTKMLRETQSSPAEIARIAALLQETLRDKLSIDNPRFDTSLEIE